MSNTPDVLQIIGCLTILFVVAFLYHFAARLVGGENNLAGLMIAVIAGPALAASAYFSLKEKLDQRRKRERKEEVDQQSTTLPPE